MNNCVCNEFELPTVANPEEKLLKKLDLIILLISAASLVLSFILQIKEIYVWRLGGWPIDPAWGAVILCGFPIIKSSIEAVLKNFDIKAGLLISLALVAAISIKEIFAAGEVAFLMMLGEILEEHSLRRSQVGLERLLNLSPKLARVLDNGQEKMLPAQEVQLGQTVLVRPGETVPVDGVLIKGESAVDQSAVTGESVPVDLFPGDTVLSGGLNRFGAFEMKATGVGKDSSINRLIRLVEEAEGKKAPLARIVDRWATIIVPMALLLAIIVGVYTGDAIRAVSILIVFCPCALVLATPTAVSAAIGAATRHGILLRSGEALEHLAGASDLAFDKTGTLTKGEMRLESITANISEDRFLALAASAEAHSEHPLGQAVVRAAREKGIIYEPSENFLMEPGLGLSAEINDESILAGRKAFITGKGIAIPQEMLEAEKNMLDKGYSIIWLTSSCGALGFLAMADVIREESKISLEKLKNEGLRITLLTGDHESAARNIASQLDIENIRFNLLPEDKVAAIEELKRGGAKVAMIGDGLNDAPALKSSTVGVAMGGIGSDVTIEAADVVLLSASIDRLPFLIKLARKTLRAIRWNMGLAMLINLVALILASLGLLGPVMSALVHNLGAVFVIFNASRLYYFRE